MDRSPYSSCRRHVAGAQHAATAGLGIELVVAVLAASNQPLGPQEVSRRAERSTAIGSPHRPFAMRSVWPPSAMTRPSTGQDTAPTGSLRWNASDGQAR